MARMGLLLWWKQLLGLAVYLGLAWFHMDLFSVPTPLQPWFDSLL